MVQTTASSFCLTLCIVACTEGNSTAVLSNSDIPSDSSSVAADVSLQDIFSPGDARHPIETVESSDLVFSSDSKNSDSNANEDDTHSPTQCEPNAPCEVPGAWCDGANCESSCICGPMGAWVCGVFNGAGCGPGNKSCFSAGGCDECTCSGGTWSCASVKKPKPNVAPSMLPPISSLPLGCTVMPGDTTAPSALQRRWIDNAEARNAICNDGSPGAYYMRPGTGLNAKKWLIHLKSGAGCQDYCSCRERWLKEGDEKMSSSCWEATLNVDGIFNPDPTMNPEFHDWTVIFVRYCTSDSHLGDAAAQPEWGGIHWRGHRIVVAIVEDLENPAINPTHNLNDATHVLMTGSSAGSAGVRHYLDWMADRMGSGVQVRGVLDASMKPEQAYAPVFGEPNTTIAATKNPWVDASCLNATGSKEACLTHTWTLLNHVTTPFFAKMTQRDAIALGNLDTTSDEAYQFAADVRELMDPVNGHLPPGTGSYSRDGTSHIDLTSDYFTTLTYQGLSFRDVLVHWIGDKQPVEDFPHVLIEYP